MYAPGTILAPHEGSDRPRLRVIGPSPVAATESGEWASAGGEAMVVTDADQFGENVVMPVTHLNVFWFIESSPEEVPDRAIIERPRPLSEQMTPEQQFQAAARQRAAEAAEAEAQAEIVAAEAAALAEAARAAEAQAVKDKAQSSRAAKGAKS